MGLSRVSSVFFRAAIDSILKGGYCLCLVLTNRSNRRDVLSSGERLKGVSGDLCRGGPRVELPIFRENEWDFIYFWVGYPMGPKPPKSEVREHWERIVSARGLWSERPLGCI